jgi:AraC-like DNA-binding protein
MEYEQKIRDSLDYIENNLNQKIQLEDLSKIAFLSKYHYHRLFHKAVGEPVKKYIRKRRMARAAAELIQTDARILDIAIKFQFGSQEAFTRAFKGIYRISPGAYRKQLNIRQPQDMHQADHNKSGRTNMRCEAA